MASSISSIPDEYLCPITRDIMINPVILIEDSCTYEESALQSWLKDHNTSPLTNNVLNNRTYTVNRALKSLINDFISQEKRPSSGLGEEFPSFNIRAGKISSNWKERATIRIKLSLLGASGVGKTVLGRSLQYGQWPKSLTCPTTTIGSDLLIYCLDQLFRDEYAVSIQLNDPPGQEKFEAITNNFFRQCHGALFLVDSTNLESLNRIKQFWYPKLNKLGMDNVESVLVCTKTDLFEKQEKNYRDLFLKHAEEFASENQIPIIYVSSYRGDNVEHVFKQLIIKILTNDTLIKDLIAQARSISQTHQIPLKLNSTSTRLNRHSNSQQQKKENKCTC